MNQHHSGESSASSSSPRNSSIVQERLLLLRATYADIKQKELEARSKRYHRALHGPASEIHLRLYREGLEKMHTFKKVQRKYASCDSSSSLCTSSTVDDSPSFCSGTSSALSFKEGHDEMKEQMPITKKWILLRAATFWAKVGFLLNQLHKTTMTDRRILSILDCWEGGLAVVPRQAKIIIYKRKIHIASIISPLYSFSCVVIHIMIRWKECVSVERKMSERKLKVGYLWHYVPCQLWWW